jgi:hypothetical protein
MRYHSRVGVEAMSSRAIPCAAVVALLSSFGCGHESAATQQVRSAASVDLECEASAIELDENKPMQVRATGCGRALTYMYQCSVTAGGGSDCRWKPVRDDSNKL